MFTFAQKKKEKEKQVQEEEVISKYEMANAEYLMIEAQKFFLLEDFERAIAFLDKSLEVDPKNHAALFKTAEINYTRGQYDKGLVAIKRAQSLEPTNKFYYLLAAQLYKAENDLSAAANEYESMIEKTQNYRDYLLDLADVYVALENYERAIEILDLTENKFNTPNKFATQKKELFIQSGNDKKAIALLKSLSTEFPNNESYQLEYADLLSSLGKNKEAEAILENSGGSTLSNIKRLNLKIEAGEINENKTEIRSAFSLQDVGLQSKLSLINNLIKIQDINQQSLFIDSLQGQLINQYPNSIEVLKSSELVYATLAASADLAQKSSYEKAELSTLKKLKDLNPADYGVWDKLLKRSFDQGSWDTLLNDAEDALSYFPNQGLFYYYFGNAQIYSNNGDKAEALSSFNQAERLSRNDKELTNKITLIKAAIINNSIPPPDLKTSPKSTSSIVISPVKGNQNSEIQELNGMLVRYASSKNNPSFAAETIQTIDALILKYPFEEELYLSKARILFQINSFAEAKSTFDQLKANYFTRGKEIDNGIILELHGDILFKLNKVDKAVEEWKKAKILGNTSDKIDKKIAEKTYYQ
jgi:tetratricopeptide (TPR) repeat protein